MNNVNHYNSNDLNLAAIEIHTHPNPTFFVFFCVIVHFEININNTIGCEFDFRWLTNLFTDFAKIYSPLFYDFLEQNFRDIKINKNQYKKNFFF